MCETEVPEPAAARTFQVKWTNQNQDEASEKGMYVTFVYGWGGTENYMDYQTWTSKFIEDI